MCYVLCALCVCVFVASSPCVCMHVLPSFQILHDFEKIQPPFQKRFLKEVSISSMCVCVCVRNLQIESHQYNKKLKKQERPPIWAIGSRENPNRVKTSTRTSTMCIRPCTLKLFFPRLSKISKFHPLKFFVCVFFFPSPDTCVCLIPP